MRLKSAVIFFVPSVLLSFVSYHLIGKNLENLLQKEQEDNKKAKELFAKNMQDIKTLDMQKIQYTISENKKDIDKIQDELSKDKDFREMLAKNMTKANFDVRSSTEMAQHLKEYSKVNNITLSKIDNLNLESNSFKKQTMNLQILGYGNYNDIINFIRDIENFSNMVEIKNIQIDKKSGLEFSLNVQGWEFKVDHKG